MRRGGLAIGAAAVLAGAGLVSVTTVRFEPALGPTVASSPPARVSFADVPRGGGLAIPVAGFARSDIRDSWGDTRSGGRGHRGIDLMAAKDTPVVAAVPGRVEKLFESELGGTTLYLRSRDGRWQHYYAHLAGYAAGLREGMKVRKGQVLGYVGDTGDAGKGNYHLHFSTNRMKAGDRWWQGEDVNPYPLLAEREGGR